MAAQGNLPEGLRVGFGFNTGVLIEGEDLFMGGAAIASDRGFGGGLSGDLVCHSLVDALLTACGLPGIEVLFPDEPELSSQEPLVTVSQTMTALLRKTMARVLNVSIKVCADLAVLEDYRKEIVLGLSAALQLEPGHVGLAIEKKNPLSASSPADTAVAFVNVLCELAPPMGKAKPRPGGGAGRQEPGDDLEGLPERALTFEKAVRSKLPPLPPAPKPQEGSALIIYTDGASRGNPGPASAAWVVLDEQGRLVGESGLFLDKRTNNEAEYLAVRYAADWIEKNIGRGHTLQFRLDSELVAKQMNGEWKIKDSKMKALAMETMNLLMYFEGFTMTSIPRTENTRADALANKVLDEQKG